MGCYATKLDDRISEHFGPSEVVRAETEATLKHRSSDCCSVDGKGALVLTQKKLWFSLDCPTIETSIPLDEITKVRATNRYLSDKAFFQGIRGLLVVDFLDVEGNCKGEKETAVFQVGDNEGWARDLAQVMKSKRLRFSR